MTATTINAKRARIISMAFIRCSPYFSRTGLSLRAAPRPIALEGGFHLGTRPGAGIPAVRRPKYFEAGDLVRASEMPAGHRGREGPIRGLRDERRRTYPVVVVPRRQIFA